jgi:hypothetical protein
MDISLGSSTFDESPMKDTASSLELLLRYMILAIGRTDMTQARAFILYLTTF